MDSYAQSRATPHGRGAQENPTGRFEAIEVQYEPLDCEEGSPIRTRFYKDHTQSIVSYNDSPDVGFTASVNPYRGCEHGCIYCYARPTHEYLGMSCGLDFETKIFVKTKAPQLLRKVLSSKSWKPQAIAFSGVTDCYQPAERHFQLTRQCLEILAEFRNPVGIVTKNALITRDIDILSDMARDQAACAFISLTTLDASLAQAMEPRAATPAMRLRTMGELAEAGIPVGVLMGPIIPGLTDYEADSILKAAADAGAQSAYYTMLRLPYGVKDLFQTWLETHFPNRKNKILHHIQGMRDGKLNVSEFGHRMVGKGSYADTIAKMFELSKKRHGLNHAIGPLSTEAFRRDQGRQLTLF